LYDITGRRLSSEAFAASARRQEVWDYVAVPAENTVLEHQVRDVLARPQVAAAIHVQRQQEPAAPWPEPKTQEPAPTPEAAAYNQLAIQLAAQRRLDEAVVALQNALQLCPDFAEAHNNLGVVLASTGKQAEAERSYREAIRLRPTYAEA